MKSLEAFDAATRRRWLIAGGVSLAVNALVFGSAGVMGHRFLMSIRPKPKPITVTRIVLPPGSVPGTLPPSPRPAPTASPTAANPHR